MKKLLNISYGSIHGAYWMSYAVFFSFASVFLLSKSYSNTMIGVILALGNIMAIILQPFLADFADRSKKFSIIQICIIISAFTIIFVGGISFSKSASFIMSVSYIIIIGLINMMQPLINTLSFKLQESGYYVNFGITRSFGSLAYAIFTSVLGALVISFGVDVLKYMALAVVLLIIISLIFTNTVFKIAKRENKADIKEVVKQEKKEKRDIDIKAFITRHKIFFVLNLGIFGLFFSNQTLNGFMLQIVKDVGGSSKDMGLVFTLLASLEIPTLILYDKIRKKVDTKKLLKISAVAYVCQISLCYLAQSVHWIFFAQLFQPFSFALVLPSMVHIINETMDEAEAVKGQSLFTMTVMLTTIIATFVGGIVIDFYGIKSLLLIGSIITFLGAGIIFLSVRKVK